MKESALRIAIATEADIPAMVEISKASMGERLGGRSLSVVLPQQPFDPGGMVQRANRLRSARRLRRLRVAESVDRAVSRRRRLPSLRHRLESDRTSGVEDQRQYLFVDRGDG